MLALITSHFNFCNFIRPQQNLYRFRLQMLSLGYPLYGVEAFLPHQKPFTKGWENWAQVMVTENQIMFQKEALLNAAEALVPPQYDKIAWLDSDIWFENKDWFSTTESLLETYKVLQLFEFCHYGSRSGNPFRTSRSLSSCPPSKQDGQPGFAWAAQRQFWRTCNGLYARAVLGSGDRVAADAFMGTGYIEDGSVGSNANDYCEWQKAVSAWVGKKLTIVPGCIYHEWHGDIKNRGYKTRRNIIRNVDLTSVTKIGINGLVEWTQNAPLKLVSAVHWYFLQRREDG